MIKDPFKQILSFLKAKKKLKRPTTIFPFIDMFVDENKNVVIFPTNWTNEPIEQMSGGPEPEMAYAYLSCYYPIELKYPYTTAELSEKIKAGLDECGKHDCHTELSGQKIIEAKYYGVKSFKRATYGKRYITLSYDPEGEDGDVALFLPTTTAYLYISMFPPRKMPKRATLTDYAKVVMEFIEADVTQLDEFKKNRKRLNWPKDLD